PAASFARSSKNLLCVCTIGSLGFAGFSHTHARQMSPPPQGALCAFMPHLPRAEGPDSRAFPPLPLRICPFSIEKTSRRRFYPSKDLPDMLSSLPAFGREHLKRDRNDRNSVSGRPALPRH